MRTNRLTGGVVFFLIFSSVSYGQVSGINSRVLIQHVTSSQLPTPNGTRGIKIVTDALSDQSCSIGGGSVKLICFDNGAWTVVGLGIEGSQGPPGEDGQDGQSATITVGDVTTGNAGSSVSIVNSGTSLDAIFDFTIPRGDTGAQGIQGETGSTGATGPAGSDGIPRTIQEEGSDLTQRLKLNFIGLSVSCADNSGQSRTDCTFTDADTGLTNPLANGSASTPGIYFTAGGGISRPGFYADNDKSIYFAANGSSRIFFDGNSAHLGLTSTSQIRFSSIADPSTGYDVNIARSGVSELTLGTTTGNYTSLRFGKSLSAVQSISISDNGNGSTRATGTLTPTYSYSSVTCNDTNGCDVSLSESGAQDGQLLRIICISSNVCGFSDSSGVSELSSSIDLGQYDSLSLLYAIDRWVEIGRSNN